MQYSRYKMFLFSLLVFLVIAAPLSAQDFVTIYSDFQRQLFGRSAARQGTVGINLYEFKKFSTGPSSEKNGTLTAVLVSSYVKSVLDDLFSNSEKIKYETSVISVLKRSGIGTIYKLIDEEYGLEFSFRLEKAGPEIYSDIDRVYGNNSYWQQIVRKLYQKNFVVRIYSSEQISNTRGSPDMFRNDLFMATLIGDRHQPLWGIHDGLGYLDNIGYALIRRDLNDFSRFLNYRKPLVNEDILYRYITRIETMGEGFVQNLDAMSRIVINVSDSEKPLKLPEILIAEEKGTKNDLALFFYDILVRKGYECLLVMVKKANDESEQKMLVLFRDKDSFNWGIIGDLPVEENIDHDWRKSIANLYRQDMKYYLMDPNDVFEDRIISAPDGSDGRYWKLAKY